MAIGTTDRLGFWMLGVCLPWGLGRRGRRYSQQHSRLGQTFLSLTIAQQPIVPDFDESLRQHMQAEPAHKLRRAQRHRLVPRSVGVILVIEADALSVRRQQPSGTEGHPMGVARQISQHLLSPLVFLVIFSTVVLHGFSIQWLSRRLGLASHAQEGVLLIGSYPFTIELARVLKSSGYPVLLVDSSWHSLREARLIGLPVHYGEILSDTTEENLDLSEMGYLFAATGNDAYNSLVCNAFVSHFGRDRVFQLGVHERDSGKEMRGSTRGRIAFGGKLHYEELIIRFFEGWRFQKTRLTKEFDYADFLQAASDNRQPLILLKKNSRIDFDFMQNNITPEPDDTIISFSLQKTEPEKK